MQTVTLKDWTNALRSGEFKQGRNMLRNTMDNTYCCLGVLAEVMERKGIPVFEHCGSSYIPSMSGSPTGKAMEAIGLGYRLQSIFAYMNDSHLRWSFAKIADWIDQHTVAGRLKYDNGPIG